MDPLKGFFKKCEEWCIIYRLSHETVSSETPNDKNVFLMKAPVCKKTALSPLFSFFPEMRIKVSGSVR